MNAQPSTAERAAPSMLFRLLGRIIAPWLQIRREPVAADAALVLPDLPVCYAIERYGLSNVLILEQACREAGLPSPLVEMPTDLTGQGRAVVATSRRNGFWFGRPRNRTHSEGLANLVAALGRDPALDVQIVPVSIFVGRAPDRESGWFRVLFAENWVIVGGFRRLLAVLLNGRNTIVRFSAPVSLRSVLAEGATPETSVRKVSRVLRTHFRRIRTAVIGPDLSHRRTLVDGLLASDPVRQAIADQARRDSISHAAAWRRAHGYAREIAADYSNTVIRSASFVLTPFWNKIYRGVKMHHFEGLKQIAPGHEVIYVPCHRSHIDYLLLSYLLYVNGVVPPHIAAGVNLNLPVVGPILRRGGAFFLRRSFKANPLYSAVFGEYVATLIARGDSIEYFIEGGRSRTGRLLQPKAGMLVMTLRAFVRQSRRPVLFQPVYIGYEQIIEGKSYLDELSGRPKQKETVWALLRAASGALRRTYGQVAVNYAEPVLLDEVLAEHAPDWRERAAEGGRQEWMNPVVDALAQRIQININRAADVNPINLLSVALLSTPKYAMSESDLLAMLDLAKTLLASAPYSDRVTITALDGAQIIAYGEASGLLVRTRHPLGDVLSFEGEQAVLQSYFRNNVQHLFVCAAWVASCFQNARRMSRAGVVRLGQLVYPFLRRELFLPWDEDGFAAQLEATIDAMVGLDLLSFDAESGQLQRGPGQTDAVFRLRVIANSVMQAFERYYIGMAVLAKNGSGTITAAELENLCHLTAQRLSLLYAPSAPEFFDRALFRGFIATLRELGLVRADEAGKLAFGEALETWANDSRLILSRELRHSILKITPDMAREAAPAEGVG
ncbi:MAG: glycerol-3-phosphate 1-O-acyltransferase PlsB [Chiayiivirga sp.]|jgi:glycerol-3-phosphate O-acyltransferase|uniref:Glycerol-3-phosphate acyltransferase n=1 Tax=Denitratimonas tolerans TaxID=1338420 RepID=A0AAW9R3B5_9GAMM|nr:glycerol-3-phosphate 1-O-acyltransferase PlsB [Xanthomonadaceae bacterium]MDX9764016.1 glycerol-3-phosphate 1-O-acyltransferase PlsB [Chiayiivirga sp.]MEB2314788.1 glycerol-3-phosphate 1-O-acyltransferase PlsB [Xanthomonadaceae bacterium]